MAKPRIFRDYELVRDEKGQVCKMYWRGDYVIPAKPTRAEKDTDKLREWERIYGRSE